MSFTPLVTTSSHYPVSNWRCLWRCFSPLYL